IVDHFRIQGLCRPTTEQEVPGARADTRSPHQQWKAHAEYLVRRFNEADKLAQLSNDPADRKARDELALQLHMHLHEHAHNPHKRREADDVQKEEWESVIKQIENPTYWEWFKRGPNRSRGPVEPPPPPAPPPNRNKGRR